MDANPIGFDSTLALFQRFAPGCCQVSAVELFLIFFNRLDAHTDCAQSYN
jgi:hypothetical protein